MSTTAVDRGLERVTVKLPDWFIEGKHEDTILGQIIQGRGDGFEVESINNEARTLTATRQRRFTEVHGSVTGNAFNLTIPKGMKPSDAPKFVTRFEDAHPGYSVTMFDPFRAQATMTRLTDDEIRCRGAVANAMGVGKTPWDVQVKSTPDGGYLLLLPKSYTPSKHDKALIEVAEEVVGVAGWWIKTDPAKLTLKITPGVPPTFPAGIPYPLTKNHGIDPHNVPLAMALPPSGEAAGETVTIDFRASHASLVGGLPRSGKSVLLRALIAGSIASGSELAIITTKSKKVDFTWCKDLVRPGGWGCESLRAAVAVAGMVYAEGERRAKILDAEGVENWYSLPPSKAFRPLLLVIDEYAIFSAKEDIPAGSKDDPDRLAAQDVQRLKNRLMKNIRESVSEMGFVGIRVVYSTQVTNAATGLPPSIKALLGHKFLIGANPSEPQRKQTFNDVGSIPIVPDNLKNDPIAGKGVGTMESEGGDPVIFKSFFASSEAYRDWLLECGAERTDRPEPTAREIILYTPAPSLADDSDDRPASGLDDGGFGQTDGRDAPAPRLKGAAAASHALNVEAAQAKRAAAAEAGPPPF